MLTVIWWAGGGGINWPVLWIPPGSFCPTRHWQQHHPMDSSGTHKGTPGTKLGRISVISKWIRRYHRYDRYYRHHRHRGNQCSTFHVQHGHQDIKYIRVIKDINGPQGYLSSWKSHIPVQPSRTAEIIDTFMGWKHFSEGYDRISRQYVALDLQHRSWPSPACRIELCNIIISAVPC
jgi:hypothetical protein